MGTGTAEDLLQDGREALAAANWERARSCFEQARELGDSAEVLDGLSQALHFQGEYAQAIELKERAFAAYQQLGNRVEAAELARWLAFLHGAVRGNMAAANGWMARAESLLGEVEECVAHGWFTLDKAPWTDNLSERERHATEALDIARRFGDRDLEFDALALLGQVYVASGRVGQGMKLLDEAMAAVSGGEVVGVAPVGEIYCRLLSACEHTADARRAEQWMAVAGRFAAWENFVSPICRLHYGGILMATGRWEEAEEELLLALRTFEGGYRAMRSGPLIRLAELRVNQGRLEEAERLLEGNEGRPAARRVLAVIALAHGNLSLAEDQVRLCLDCEDPSAPACLPLLELLVEIKLAGDDIAAARQTMDQLIELATSCGDERSRALAAFAKGRVLAAEGNAQASSQLQAALESFLTLDLPFAAARVRLGLAEAIASGARDAAVAEARLALEGFERLGAARDVDRAAKLLRELGGAGRAWPKRYGELTKRETEVLSLVAAGCSNAEIGERLYISRRTAEHHVASILSKLGLRSRTEAAAYATRELPEDP